MTTPLAPTPHQRPRCSCTCAFVLFDCFVHVFIVAGYVTCCASVIVHDTYILYCMNEMCV